MDLIIPFQFPPDTLLKVSIDLTDEGLKHRYEIVELVFAYVDMIKRGGLPDYIVPEVEQLFKIGFDFSENRDPTATVSSAVADMQLYTPERYLTGSRLIIPNEDDVRSYLSNFVPEQVMILTASKMFEGKTQLHGKWYDTAYNKVSNIAHLFMVELVLLAHDTHCYIQG